MSEPDESLRVSDAERDAVLRTLGDHAALGRLTLAEIEGGELTLTLFAFMGGANIYVPDSVDLEVGGFSFMGGASIYRLPPQARGVSLKDARRLAKSAERGELPAPG